MKNNDKCLKCDSAVVDLGSRIKCTNKDCGFTCAKSDFGWAAYKRWCYENGKKESSVKSLLGFKQ